MLFGDFLTMMYNYCGEPGLNKQDFLTYLCPLIMKPPVSIEDKMADERDDYYPFSGKKGDRSLSLKLFSDDSVSFNEIPKYGCKASRKSCKYEAPTRPDFGRVFSKIA